MSTGKLKEIVTGKPAQQPTTFPGMLQAYKGQIAAALPRHVNPDRMARIALTCYRMNPGLAECSPASVFAAVIQAAQLGLEPGLNGRAYLIPYKREATFVPGWRGLVQLANRTGRCSVWTGAVFDGDSFDYALGDRPRIDHKPGDEDDPKKLLYAYAVGRVRGSEWPVIEVWSSKRIEKHRNRYNRQGERHYSYREWEMYARKVVLLQVLKYLPASPELETAVSLNDAAEVGEQHLNLDEILSGGGNTIEGSSAAVTDFDKLIATMNSRKDVDALDADATLIGSLATDEQRLAARDVYMERRGELAGQA